MNKVRSLIDQFALLPHPEGGYYARSYCSQTMIDVPGFAGPRPFSTAICFLLEKGNFSAFHRIKSDECWHFYEGQALLIHIIDPSGKYSTIRLGAGPGACYQYVVPAGCWFASEPAPESDYAFVGCTVSPGFDFADFEMAVSEELTVQYPAQQELIRRLCRL